MSDLFRSLPSVAEKPPSHSRPGARVLLTPRHRSSTDPDPDASSSDSSASTLDSIDTLRPSNENDKTINSMFPTIPWPDYFEQELHLPVDNPAQRALYHVYLTPPASPTKGPLFICHHGAGASGMSFALFAKQIRQIMPEAGVLSLEARAHGSVVTSEHSNEDILDFSVETLTSDAMAMIDAVQAKQGWKTLPPSIFVGHSLGGVVAVRVAAEGKLGAQLVGFQVLDVVEGSAMEALSFMKTYLASRPARFDSVDDAVDWHVRSRTLRNVESARASVPGQLKAADGGGWTWKTDLTQTPRWWESWFKGMSETFLRGRAAKALVLAGTDRLDKELMVGQMQGKFQLTVIPEAGHFIQEDVPEKMAQLSVEFFKRNDRSAMVLPPKVSDLLAQGKKV
ncbi:protein phosphatase methylesteras-like protein 1 [Myriangium duriaei CBS 260.36]|uniref:Protein phosphatase methylesterase 1 n=1 Tax=Myriangium duriaei CBS 260.36 TaxID=1168546 RepID=A0A9P4J6S1_9PEZI|nr:protein phosphatase methylesteras-like protein 1 [Myriangium duriaei CBS 260.36]